MPIIKQGSQTSSYLVNCQYTGAQAYLMKYRQANQYTNEVYNYGPK